MSCQYTWMIPCCICTIRERSVSSQPYEIVVRKYKMYEKNLPKCLQYVQLFSFCSWWWVISLMFGVYRPFDSTGNPLPPSLGGGGKREVTEVWMWWQEGECVQRTGSGDYMRGFPLISVSDTMTFQQNEVEGFDMRHLGVNIWLNSFRFLGGFFKGREKNDQTKA